MPTGAWPGSPTSPRSYKPTTIPGGVRDEILSVTLTQPPPTEFGIAHWSSAVGAWLAHDPRVRLHFTSTSGSWLNLVEIFFGIITGQAIRRSTFTSMCDLVAAIERYIDAWNDRCQPFS